MLDSFPVPNATAQTPRTTAPPPGHKAGGGAAIEIFTSFHSLVDALEKDADADAAAGAARQARGAGDGKAAEETSALAVMPVDLAALLLSTTVGPPADGGTAPEGAADGHGAHPLTAADLAALLLSGRGAKAGALLASGAEAAPGADDTVEVSDGEPVLPSGPAVDAMPSGARADRIADTLAQALAQRMLASAAGPRQLAEALAGHAGAGSRHPAEELLQSLLAPDRTAGSMNPASRLVAQVASSLAASSAAPIVASGVGTPAFYSNELPAETADQIIQTLRMVWSQGGGEAQIRLEPRQFGDLTVSLRVDRGQVVARVQADTAVVRDWLAANEHVLRQSLADQHLTLTRLEVSEPSAESRQRGPRDGNGQPAPDGRPARRPREAETGETFDVVA